MIIAQSVMYSIWKHVDFLISLYYPLGVLRGNVRSSSRGLFRCGKFHDTYTSLESASSNSYKVSGHFT